MQTSFDVKYPTGRRGIFNSHRWGNPYQFAGHGTLRLDGANIVFRGRRRTPFVWQGWQEFGVPLSAVCNVQLHGRMLGFDLRADDGKLHEVVLQVAQANDALALAERLPREQTEAFVIEREELEDFRERMLAFQPAIPVTWGLIAVNAIIFLLMVWSSASLFSISGEVAKSLGSNDGALTLAGQWWRLFTSMFLHFGLMHFALNMFSLWVIGSLCERLFGSIRYLGAYLAAGMTGSVASVVWHPALNSAGASGAIFGIFGALLAFVLDDRNAVPPTVRRKMSRDMAIMIGVNLLFGLHMGIDNAAHIGGLVGGVVLGSLLARPLPHLSR